MGDITVLVKADEGKIPFKDSNQSFGYLKSENDSSNSPLMGDPSIVLITPPKRDGRRTAGWRLRCAEIWVIKSEEEEIWIWKQLFETRDKIQFRCFLAFTRRIGASGIVPLSQQLVDVYDQRYRFFDFTGEGS